MAGQSTAGTVVKTGRLFAQQSAMNRVGPSNKNLGPNRNAQANPTGKIRAVTSPQIKGPDRGAGSS